MDRHTHQWLLFVCVSEWSCMSMCVILCVRVILFFVCVWSCAWIRNWWNLFCCWVFGVFRFLIRGCVDAEFRRRQKQCGMPKFMLSESQARYKTLKYDFVWTDCVFLRNYSISKLLAPSSNKIWGNREIKEDPFKEILELERKMQWSYFLYIIMWSLEGHAIFNTR